MGFCKRKSMVNNNHSLSLKLCNTFKNYQLKSRLLKVFLVLLYIYMLANSFVKCCQIIKGAQFKSQCIAIKENFHYMKPLFMWKLLVHLPAY